MWQELELIKKGKKIIQKIGKQVQRFSFLSMYLTWDLICLFVCKLPVSTLSATFGITSTSQAPLDSPIENQQATVSFSKWWPCNVCVEMSVCVHVCGCESAHTCVCVNVCVWFLCTNSDIFVMFLWMHVWCCSHTSHPVWRCVWQKQHQSDDIYAFCPFLHQMCLSAALLLGSQLWWSSLWF